MKLIFCPQCNQSLKNKTGKITKCGCKKSAGKYLSDNITAVFNKGVIIIGIDNTTFRNAIYSQNDVLKKYPEWPRVDFFFTGWIPTIPGEVIIVDSVWKVRCYPTKVKKKKVYSTMPVSL